MLNQSDVYRETHTHAHIMYSCIDLAFSDFGGIYIYIYMHECMCIYVYMLHYVPSPASFGVRRFWHCRSPCSLDQALWLHVRRSHGCPGFGCRDSGGHWGDIGGLRELWVGFIYIYIYIYIHIILTVVAKLQPAIESACQERAPLLCRPHCNMAHQLKKAFTATPSCNGGTSCSSALVTFRFDAVLPTLPMYVKLKRLQVCRSCPPAPPSWKAAG